MLRLDSHRLGRRVPKATRPTRGFAASPAPPAKTKGAGGGGHNPTPAGGGSPRLRRNRREHDRGAEAA